MAARILKPRHQDEVRTKIQSSQLINRLQNHALDLLDKPMDATQISAALGLLKKSIPDLSATTIGNPDGSPLLKGIKVTFDGK